MKTQGALSEIGFDLSFDRQHIWHPYTSMKNPPPVFPIERADGVRLYLQNGKSLVDGMSSWWSAIHGYNHPEINLAIEKQSAKMAHVMFGGLTHAPAIELAKNLTSITPKPLNKIFLADSGSISVEVAIKMALQYWQSQGHHEKTKLITIRNGYHGDTFGAMSVCDPINGMHHLFSGILPKHIFVEAPSCKYGETWHDQHISQMQQAIEKNHNHVAAVILEPIVQGAGGMRFYSPVYLQKLRMLCDAYYILLIFDEIATGFGRTGHLFASDLADVSPDIMCVGKALTAGYMTLAATLCTEKVCNTISEHGPLMHGPTFMANPLACSVANANLKLLATENWKQQTTQIEHILKQELGGCRSFKGVYDVRVLGAIGVIEMEHPVSLHTIQPKFVSKGIWIRPFGKLIYTMPPYIIDSHDLVYLTDKTKEVISELSF